MPETDDRLRDLFKEAAATGQSRPGAGGGRRHHRRGGGPRRVRRPAVTAAACVVLAGAGPDAAAALLPGGCSPPPQPSHRTSLSLSPSAGAPTEPSATMPDPAEHLTSPTPSARRPEATTPAWAGARPSPPSTRRRPPPTRCPRSLRCLRTSRATAPRLTF